MLMPCTTGHRVIDVLNAFLFVNVNALATGHRVIDVLNAILFINVNALHDRTSCN